MQSKLTGQLNCPTDWGDSLPFSTLRALREDPWGKTSARVRYNGRTPATCLYSILIAPIVKLYTETCATFFAGAF